MQIINLVEFKLLVEKWVLDELSDQDLLRLYQFLKQDAYRNQFENCVEEIYASQENFEVDRDWDKIYQTIQASTKEKPGLNRKSIVSLISAAVILLVCGISYFNWHSSNEQGNEVQVVQRISNGFVLKDEAGSSIDLLATGDAGQKSFILEDNILQLNSNTNELKYYTLENPIGAAPVELKLADGSMLVINAGSQVRFPNHFELDRRNVSMEGEVQFKVQHADNKPFFVETRGLTIQVLGTTFNVNSYTNEDYVQTTLLEGKVKLVNGLGDELYLKPGEQGLFHVTDQGMSSHPVSAQQVLSWKDGTLLIADESLAAVLKKIERIYNVQCIYEGTFQDVKIWGALSIEEKLSDLLPVLEKVGSVQLRLDGRTIYVKQQ